MVLLYQKVPFFDGTSCVKIWRCTGTVFSAAPP